MSIQLLQIAIKSTGLVVILLNVILFALHLPLAPFSTPGTRANEAVIVHLAFMVLRWGATALLIGLLGVLAIFTQAPKKTTFACILVAWGIHAALGRMNLIIWNKWISSTSASYATLHLWLLAGAYLVTPLVTLLACYKTWSVISAKT